MKEREKGRRSVWKTIAEWGFTAYLTLGFLTAFLVLSQACAVLFPDHVRV